jgi:hypothetical protein
MTLNVNLEDVPWAILEAVRGRIMSNRRRLEESQQEQQRPALQPKPQFRKFGADGRTWKRPEPAAVAIDKSYKVAGAYFIYNTFENTITVWNSSKAQSATAAVPAISGESSYLEWWLCLPAGNDKLVLVFYSTSVKISYTTETRSNSQAVTTPNEVINGSALRSETDARAQRGVDDYMAIWSEIETGPPDSRPSEPEAYINGVLYNDDYTETTIEYPYSAINTAVDTDYAQGLTVFLVGNNTVSSIEPPQSFSTFLLNNFYSLAGVDVIRSNRFYTVKKAHVVQYAVDIVRSRLRWVAVGDDPFQYMLIRFFDSPVGPDMFDPQVFQNQFSEETFSEEQVSAFPNYTDLPFPDPEQLLRSYGYGLLVDRGEEQSAEWGWTPSIYAYIRKIQQVEYDESNYASVRSKYLGSDAPRDALTLGYQSPGSERDTTSTHYVFSIPTSPTADALAPVDFNSTSLRLRPVVSGTRKSPVSTQLTPEEVRDQFYLDVEVPVVAWDWNRPSACIGELMALGFTAQQLGYTGTTPPARFEF